MGIQIASNFDLFSTKPLDSRQQFETLADMVAFSDTSLSEGLMTYCIETGKYYTFKSTNPVDAITGKWRVFEGGGGVDNHVTLTKSQYDQLVADGLIDESIYYHITDDCFDNHVTLTKAEYDQLVADGLINEDVYYHITDDSNVQLGCLVFEDYSFLPTTNNRDEIVYVMNDYEDTSVVPSVMYTKGFYLYRTATALWELTSVGNNVNTSQDVDNTLVETVEIVAGTQENIPCTQTVTTVGNETTTIIVADADSSDTSILQAGDVVSIIKEINGIIIYEYHFDDSDDFYNPFI